MRNTKSEPVSIYVYVVIIPYPFTLFHCLQSTFIYTVSFNPHKDTVRKRGIIPVLWRRNLSSTKRVVDVGFELKSPIVQNLGSNLAHCTGIEDLTKGLGWLLATV